MYFSILEGLIELTDNCFTTTPDIKRLLRLKINNNFNRLVLLCILSYGAGRPHRFRSGTWAARTGLAVGTPRTGPGLAARTPRTGPRSAPGIPPLRADSVSWYWTRLRIVLNLVNVFNSNKVMKLRLYWLFYFSCCFILKWKRVTVKNGSQFRNHIVIWSKRCLDKKPEFKATIWR